ncbi:YqeG family HAD IIIA-type phosphatase [Metabacillus sediminilitoris]|uniref:YqeG family HAD IIIA-type phosphatase n=1 Tax=Metabacillus sediminilitoris TaxID=2567941 RepID=A0A4S4C4S3_9BACI|nr:YqeG family HAD IIIA-type phosphatase [Metabacillus sediminilitoris]QGQ47348.1 YqeG family HAD IIIA-type phosphatase [Metabacillus sediminilitoris]THF80691.1 YqeG family HAD IIIA-type phosphatase [Metabacillus sediminilitoris]
MLQQFLPGDYVKSIFHISPEKLKESGIKGIITDLDNTLVEWDRPNATPQLVEWFKDVKEQGIDITIVSNNNERRVKAFSDPLNIPFIHKARKPMGKAFLKAVKNMNLKKEEVVVIGDQLLTDVLGGNRSGFQTILVVPVASTDGFFTRINRKIERRIMESLKRKGMIQWEE